MIVVADASPLIFLAKIHQLELVLRLFPGELLVPTAVRDGVVRQNPGRPVFEGGVAPQVHTAQAHRGFRAGSSNSSSHGQERNEHRIRVFGNSEWVWRSWQPASMVSRGETSKTTPPVSRTGDEDRRPQISRPRSPVVAAGQRGERAHPRNRAKPGLPVFFLQSIWVDENR